MVDESAARVAPLLAPNETRMCDTIDKKIKKKKSGRCHDALWFRLV